MVEVVAGTLVCAATLEETVSWATLELDDDGAAAELLLLLLLLRIVCCVEDGGADVAAEEATTLVDVALPSCRFATGTWNFSSSPRNSS